jgi:signal transduction histidine kinase
MRNPFALEQPTILIQQLRLVMGNFRNTVIIIPVCFIIWYSLANPLNNDHLVRWAVTAVFTNILLQGYGWYYLKHGMRLKNLQSKARFYALLHSFDGIAWGLLSWLVIGTETENATIIIIALFAGILGAGLATLSAIPILFIAFTLPHTLAITITLWLSDDPSYQSMAIIAVLYFISLTGQVINSSKIIKSSIINKIELEKSNHRLRKIERLQTLQQERQRLMQEMHDGLGSTLLSALRVVEKGNMPSHEVAQVLKECIDDLKLAIDSIEPVDEDLLLLLATLRFRIGTRLENSGIILHWNVAEIPPLEWLNPSCSLHVLRILQEALTNIIKHSGATEVRLSTHTTSTHIIVEIADNGCGFDAQHALSETGRGLSNQLQRAAAIGAEVRWVTQQRGSRFQLVLPIDQRLVVVTV